MNYPNPNELTGDFETDLKRLAPASEPSIGPTFQNLPNRKKIIKKKKAQREARKKNRRKK